MNWRGGGFPKLEYRGELGRVTAFETRCYVQDERYFAIEHMDVRREVFQAGTACQVALRQHPSAIAPALLYLLHPCSRVGDGLRSSYPPRLWRLHWLLQS